MIIRADASAASRARDKRRVTGAKLTIAQAAAAVRAIDPERGREVALLLNTRGFWTTLCSDYAAGDVLAHPDLVEEALRDFGYLGDVLVHVLVKVAPYGEIDSLVNIAGVEAIEAVEFEIAAHLVAAHPRPVAPRP